MAQAQIEDILVLTEEEENTPLFVSPRARRSVQHACRPSPPFHNPEQSQTESFQSFASGRSYTFLVAVLGAFGLLAFCYREQSHEAYAIVLLPMCVPFVLFSILSPLSFTLAGASTGAIWRISPISPTRKNGTSRTLLNQSTVISLIEVANGISVTYQREIPGFITCLRRLNKSMSSAYEELFPPENGFENLKLWSEIISYQVTSVALPAQTFPLNFVTSYVSVASFLERLLHHDREDFSFASIESYIEEINRTADNSVFLTGHSMGGGLAKIIGSRQKVTTVSFSSPGELCIRAKMGFTLDDLQRYTTSVVSRDDMVTWVDFHGGLVQHIGCNASSYVQCHSIVNTYCELKRSCGFHTPVTCSTR
ncbi:hypothetical protein OS493_025811 [Desmophyllum pertusum]|uniref:Fungal lipase-like domain-containing protein n=1 Tax=Desmophyllum pertusum TaxID=174260 RepID=A0A9W9ZAI1_9CNID|nr:hypothetical protein OS493_025811 [Desmophyllum pertusum]